MFCEFTSWHWPSPSPVPVGGGESVIIISGACLSVVTMLSVKAYEADVKSRSSSGNVK